MLKYVNCNLPDDIEPSPVFISQTAAEILEEHGSREYIISISMIDDAEMADLNQRFKGFAGSTDVLSFVLDESPLEAEIYLNREQIRLSADADGISERIEIVKLVIHGILHLLGYHHRTSEERAVNDRMMREYLNKYIL